MARVDTNHNLNRQDHTPGVIENTDKSGYEAFIKTRNAKIEALKSQEEIKNLKLKVDVLSEKLDKVIELLGESS